MSPKYEDPRFEGEPLSGLRGLPSKYFNEDPVAGRPDPAEFSHDSSAPVSHYKLEGSFDPDTPAELGNKDLPITPYKYDILNAVENHPVVLLRAETGSGKSTQLPQILYDGGYSVYLTQPRRAAARNVYSRIREEVDGVLGEAAADDIVSYVTAGEREGLADAPIQVVTDGLQLMRELHREGVNPKTVLIIDEAHERNGNIDILLALAKRAVVDEPNFRCTITSANLDQKRFSAYFDDVCATPPPILEIPGRNFYVDKSSEPESTVVDEALKYARRIYDKQPSLGEPNGIQIFVPGVREIDDVMDEIRKRLPPEIAKTAIVLPLHAKLSVDEQQAALRSYPGIKIVVETNIAQTSLTQPDTVCVIDSGLERRPELDRRGVQGLVLNPISQSDCDQRAGRAGRVSDGSYVLTRLDEKTPFISYEDREFFPMPEILRTDIVRNTLRFASVGLDIQEVDIISPVSSDAIERSQGVLKMLHALDDENKITTTGKRMDQFPVSVSSSRMMVEVERYAENTRAYMAAIVASKEVGNLQHFGHNIPKGWRQLTEEHTSDMLVQLDLFIAAQNMTAAEMKQHNLDPQNIERAREQYRKIAKKVHALQDELLPPTTEEREDIKNCILQGLATSVYKHGGSGDYFHVGMEDEPRQISNRSEVTGRPAAVVGDAYRVEFPSQGGIETRHIIESVTATTLTQIGRIATDQAVWKNDGFVWRNGRVRKVERQYIFGEDLGNVRELLAEPSPQLREEMIGNALEHPGPQQRILRDIKTTMEEMAHYAKDPVPQLTQDNLIALIREAVEGTTDSTEVDNNLRLLMVKKGISLDEFVSPERREQIVANAPPSITQDDVTLEVTYRSRRPLVRTYSSQDIAKLTDEVFLADGRQVLFLYGKPAKVCSLMELRDKLDLI